MVDELTIVVKTRGDLEELLDHHRAMLMPRSHHRLIFELPNLSKQENELWEKRVERLYFACGCGEGSGFLVCAVIAWGVYSCLTWQVERLILDIAYGVLFVVAASVLGKVFGLALAKFRLRKTVVEVLKKT